MFASRASSNILNILDQYCFCLFSIVNHGQRLVSAMLTDKEDIALIMRALKAFTF